MTRAPKTRQSIPTRNRSAAHLVTTERDGAVLQLKLNRPDKRNALSDALVDAIKRAFESIPDDIAAVVLAGNGDHFCAGLDLNELAERDAAQSAMHSRTWHQAFRAIQFGRTPVVCALHGAVVGGGLELACATHIRVAEPSTFYALPEGQRGIFVGGGGSVRIQSIIGTARMTDLMLTGRSYSAEEGQQCALSQYLVGQGEAIAHATMLAKRIAANAPLSNYAIVQALPRISRMSADDGLFTEALIAGITAADEEAKARMRAFVEGRGKKIGR